MRCIVHEYKEPDESEGIRYYSLDSVSEVEIYHNYSICNKKHIIGMELYYLNGNTEHLTISISKNKLRKKDLNKFMDDIRSEFEECIYQMENLFYFNRVVHQELQSSKEVL